MVRGLKYGLQVSKVLAATGLGLSGIVFFFGINANATSLESPRIKEKGDVTVFNYSHGKVRYNSQRNKLTYITDIQLTPCQKVEQSYVQNNSDGTIQFHISIVETVPGGVTCGGVAVQKVFIPTTEFDFTEEEIKNLPARLTFSRSSSSIIPGRN